MIVKRLLDVGATTLLFPMIQILEEALAAVRSTRYQPNGIRGISMATRANRYGRIKDYMKRAHEEICVLVQVESRAAIERAGRSPRCRASTACSSVLAIFRPISA